MTALLPCPFCGSEPELDHYPASEGFELWYVECACGARLDPIAPDQEAASKAWNTRIAPSLRTTKDDL